MPLFYYECSNCGNVDRGLGKQDEMRDCSVCGANVMPSIPRNVNSLMMETKDPYRGVKHFKNQKELMKERNTHHHDKYELAEKIDKYGLDEAKRLGWLKKGEKQ